MVIQPSTPLLSLPAEGLTLADKQDVDWALPMSDAPGHDAIARPAQSGCSV